jgi:hypothetical protein
MQFTAPRDHPVHRARLDLHRGAERIAVEEPALVEIGDRREPDMRMRAHVDPLVGDELGGAHLVEEDEGPHHLAARGGQRAAHLEVSDVTRAGDDDGLDRVDGLGCRRAVGVEAWVPAHRGDPSHGPGLPWPGGLRAKMLPRA